MTTIALLGTGLLGSAMVENLLQKGAAVRVWNRTRDKLAPLAAKGAVAAADPADCVRGADRVHLVLTDDAVVDAVLAPALPALGRGVPIYDHSTNQPAKVAARFAALRAQGVRYVSAPVFMSPGNAREASGLVVYTAPAAEQAAVEADLAPMTGKVWCAGERADLAAVHKLAGNSVFFALAAAMADVLAIGAGCGVPAEQMLAFYDVFKPGVALPFLGQRVARGGAGRASFELQMARKDVRLCLESAGAEPTLVLPAVAAAMDRALAQGKAQSDYAVFTRG
ncbi:MAG: NAD(P)-dependent oxidoreductase [Planctomycetota bacterium]